MIIENINILVLIVLRIIDLYKFLCRILFEKIGEIKCLV